MVERFDAIIIGTGQAGVPLAGRLSAAGKKIAIIERHLVGGTCVNTGCNPTKTLVSCAYVAHMARRAADYGVGTGAVTVDMARVRARTQEIVLGGRTADEAWLRALPGCCLIFGHARFVSSKSVRVADREFSADLIFINVGTRPLIPQLPGSSKVTLLTNSSLLDLEVLPEHLVVIGGSYVGLEFGQAFRRFGSNVTVVEKGQRILSREDENVSAAIREMLEGEGVIFRTSAECINFAPRGKAVTVGLNCAEGEPAIAASHVLVAVGRVPNTDDLGLEHTDIERDARGYIIVDDQLSTTERGVWALGDCNGRGAFTHTSYDDFEIVAENLIENSMRRVSDRIPCYALFTDPPLGRVGLSAAQASAAGHRIRVGRRNMSQVARAVEKNESIGFMEIVVDADTDAILGGTIFGVSGDEAVHSMIDMMANGATSRKLRRTMHIHPTVSELIPTIAGEAV